MSRQPVLSDEGAHMLCEDESERMQFDRTVVALGRPPLRHVADGLRVWSKTAPEQGSYGKMCAIYANECTLAADALEGACSANNRLRDKWASACASLIEVRRDLIAIHDRCKEKYNLESPSPVANAYLDQAIGISHAIDLLGNAIIKSGGDL